MLPTPVATEYKFTVKRQQYTKRSRTKKQIQLSHEIAHRWKTDGLLNPRFVEQMMGFPAGWTKLTQPELVVIRESRKYSSHTNARPGCKVKYADNQNNSLAA